MRIIGKQSRLLWWWLWLAAACLAAAVFPVGAQDGTGCRFSDVSQSSPQQADIVYACQQGWFQGYPGGTFSPDREVPQNQIAVVVSRAFPTGSTRADLATFLRGGNPGAPDGSADFGDVAESHPQNQDIAYAVEQGWFQGYPDGTFRPDRTITPIQIATVVSRAFPSGSTRADLATFMRRGSQSLNYLTPPTSKIVYTVPIYDSLGDQVALELWVSGADGSDARRLTDDAFELLYWSPGGDRIAYWVAVRDFRGNEMAWDLRVAEADGSRDDHITSDAVERLWWSPGGDRIAYTVPMYDSVGDEMSRELWVAGSDGSGARKLTDDVGVSAGSLGYPPIRWGWSPGGERIFYTVPMYDSVGDEMSRELWVAGSDGSGARKLTDDVNYWSWRWSPKRERFAYEVKARDFEGNRDEWGLWVVDADGSEPRRLTDYYSRWRWSPDGEYIVAYGGELWVVGADGSGARQLVNNIWEDLWWSPDGRWIAYEAWNSLDGAWELWAVGLDGSGARRLIQVFINGSGPSPFSKFWWSEGQSIVLEVSKREGRYSSGNVVSKELWIVGVDGSSTHRLTEDFAYNWGWSPGRERIAYESKVYEFGKWLGTGLWVADTDGSNARQITNDVESWGWSPGGDRIAYEVKKRDSRRSVVGSELWIVGSDGLRAQRLTDDVANNIWGWLPNSERIVYGVNTRDSSGNKVGEQLWVTGVDASPRQLADDIAINDWTFSSDGEWIAYGVDSSGSNVGEELWVASADGSATRKLAEDVDNWWWQPMSR